MKVSTRSTRNPFHRLARSKLAQAAAMAFFSLSVGVAQAALPESEAPSRGEGTGIVNLIQNYAYDVIVLIALIVCAVGFLGVSYHSFTTFGEVQTGRKSWGQFGSVVAVGGGLLVLVIWLVSKASEIL